MNKIDNYTIIDESLNGYNSILIGTPKPIIIPTDEIILNQIKSTFSPSFSIIEGEINNQITVIKDTILLENEPLSLITYKLVNKAIEIDSITYVWLPGIFYTYDENGIPVDSIIVEADEIVKQDTLKYYSQPI